MVKKRSTAASQRKQPQKYYSMSCRRKDFGSDSVYGLCFNRLDPRFQNLFAACGGCRVNVYELQPQAKAMRPVQSYADEDPAESYYCCAWGADCITGTPLLAVAGEKAAIRIIHIGRMKSVACLQGHGRSINDLRFLPSDPNMLLSCSSDESCRLWNVVTLQLAVIFGGWHGHRSAVLSLDVHLLGRMFASCGMDNSIRVWSLNSAEVLQAVQSSYLDLKDALFVGSVPPPPRCVASSATLATLNSPKSKLSPPSTPNCSAPSSSRISSKQPLSSQSPSSPIISPPPNTTSSRKRSLSCLSPSHVIYGPHSPPLSSQTALGPHRPYIEHSPLFQTAKVHLDYVDCVRWLGNLLITKSTRPSLTVWVPRLWDGHDAPQEGSGAAAAERLADSVLVCAELQYTNSQIWFIRFDVDQSSKLVCVGNQAGEIFVWMLSGTEFVQVSSCSCKKHPACVRQTALAATGHIIVATDDGALMLFSPSGSGVDANAADEDE